MNLTLQVPHLDVQRLRLRVEPPHSPLHLYLVFDHVKRGGRHGLTGVFGVLHATGEIHSDGFGFCEEVERLEVFALDGNVAGNHGAASV